MGGESFITVGVDVWNGTPQQVDLFFRLETGSTYPLLLEAYRVGSDWGFGHTNFAVVDHEGVVRYMSSPIRQTADVPAIRGAIEAALAELAASQIEEMPPPDMTVVGAEAALPEGYVLRANFPNPFNASTAIGFALPETGRVALRVFDALGRPVRTLLQRALPAGDHRVDWNGLDDGGHRLASGVYIYRLEVAGRILSRKMTLLR